MLLGSLQGSAPVNDDHAKAAGLGLEGPLPANGCRTAHLRYLLVPGCGKPS